MDPDPIRIRPARAADAETIVRFNSGLARETEGIELDPARLARGVAAVLDDPRRGRYWIAERGGEPVGQCMVTYEWSDWRDGDFWWIQSVWVEPAHRRVGVYRALHEHVMREAEAERACGVRLYVEKRNRGARAVYERVGLEEAPYEMLERDFVLRGGR